MTSDNYMSIAASIGEKMESSAVAMIEDAYLRMKSERDAYRKSLEQAVAWARAKCERIGVAEEAWLEDARALLRGDAK